MALNKDFERFTKMLTDFNQHLGILKGLIERSNSSYKEILAEKDTCMQFTVDIQRILKEGGFNKSDNLKVKKLNGDFQKSIIPEKLLKVYEGLILKVKNMQFDQVADLQVKSKRASVIGMSIRMKDQGKNEQKDTEFYEDEDLHQHVEHYENLILEKNNEIKEVERDVVAINNMMKDVANMVVQQGEQLDHIEFNIKNTHQDVKDAEKEMISAKEYQKSYRKKLCCLLMVIVTIVSIVVLVIVLTTK